MTPETPPPHGPDPEREAPRPRSDPPFGPEAAASLERSLAQLHDPDDGLRLLSSAKRNGAGFAAYLMLPDTNLAAEDTFHNTYVDAWQRFDQFRTDVIEGLGWTDALKALLANEGIPADHLIWNHVAIDKQILETYDAIHLDGWWHVFQK